MKHATRMIKPLTGLFTKTTCGNEISRVSVQGVQSLGGHFACLCQGFEFYEVKKFFFVIIFQNENGNKYTFYHFYSKKSSKRVK